MPTSDKGDSFAALFEAAPKTRGTRRYRPGEVLDVEVVRVGADAVLVALDPKQEGFIAPEDLPQVDGKPKVLVGSRIAVRVAAIERGTGSVRLTPLSADPIVEGLAPEGAAGAKPAGDGPKVVVGMRVKAKVTGVERYGVFVEFPVPGQTRPERGLVPVAELGAPRGADLRKAFPVGHELEAAVLSIDERGRLRLSVTALARAEEQRAFQAYAAGGKPEGKSADAQPARGFGTLGDLLKKKK
jgi:small subunit ribosomal protein S1